MDSQITHWMQAIASLRSAIRSGTVREQAEKASLSSPRSVERLRRHDKLLLQNVDGSILTSVDNSGRRLRYNSPASRQDKLIHDWKERISNVHTPLHISLMCLCCYLALLLSHTDFPKAITDS